MQNGFYSSVGGMVTQFNRLDVVSHNLANLNTGGFRRDDVVIGDYMRLFQEYQDNLPIEDNSRDVARFINRNLNRVPIISEEYTDYSMGQMQRTEGSLDFALKSPNTFFAVQTPNGVAYTRNGSFNLDSDGYIVTKDGFRVLSRDGLNDGSGLLLPSGVELSVDSNGNISLTDVAGAGEGGVIDGGSLAIVTFDNPKFLKKVGSSLFVEHVDSSGAGRAVPSLSTNSGSLVQGFLEKSNVNAVIEMTNMIETNRLVDMYSKVMKTHMDELNSEAVGKLAVKA